MDMFRHLGLTISVLRRLRRMSQACLAREAGIGKSQLSKYERGKELPKFDSLGKILAALDVTPLGFFHTLDFLRRRDEAPEAVVLPDDLSILSTKTQEKIRDLVGDVLSLHEALLEEKLASSRGVEENGE